jgi:hypothetical protein
MKPGSDGSETLIHMNVFEEENISFYLYKSTKTLIDFDFNLFFDYKIYFSRVNSLLKSYIGNIFSVELPP